MESGKSASDSEQGDEKSSGSKMLKKARSFRDDIKTRIKRRPSTGAQQMIPENKQMKGKSKANSGEMYIDVADGKDDVENESDKLHRDMEEIDRSMNFIRAVLNRGELLLIPQVASTLLEITLDIFTRLSSLILSQESTTLSSGHNKVCQSLARFIRWSDSFLLDGTNNDIDKENADEIISTLAEGVRELTRLCMDKMAAKRSAAEQRSPTQASLSPTLADGSTRSSLPDIPLTPRERQILQQTSDLGIYDNASSPSALPPSTTHAPTIFTFDPASHDFPPPKPPLPQGAAELLARQRNGLEFGNNADEPPPLPEKRRSAGTSMLDSLTSSTASSATPTQSPYASMCLEAGALSPSGSPQSRSPTSSVGSGLDRSTEDLLSATATPSMVTSVARTQSDSRIASLSAHMQSGRSQTTCEEINQLTKKIKEMTTSIEGVPPPLPTKRNLMRLHSQYDNVPADGTTSSSAAGAGSLISSSSLTSVSSRTVVTRTHESRISTASSSSSQSSHSFLSSQSVQSGRAWNNTSMAFGPGGGSTAERASSHETYSSSETFSSTASHSSTESLPKPPPLPPKKRHIQAYMQTFGAMTQPISLESISRHSINFYEAQWHQHQMELFQPLYPRSNTISVISDISSFSSDTSFSSGSPERFSLELFASGIPSLPVKTRRAVNRQSHMSTESSQSDMSGGELGVDKTQSMVEPASLPLIPDFSEMKRSSAPAQVVSTVTSPTSPPPLPPSPTKSEIQRDADSDFAELNPLDDVDVSDQLVRKRPGEEGPEIRGGSVDALIVHATSAGNSGLECEEDNAEEFIYQEAFLTTYRTFISPKALMEKLLYRFYKFQHAKDSKKRLAMNGFSLLIRVIDELGFTELDGDVQHRMTELVYELLCQGDLTLAKVLRKKLLDKRKQQLEAQEQQPTAPVQNMTLIPSHSPDLLHFKSHEIAENMTQLDAALFQKIEIPEVLLWAKEQSEELSPHLTHFTEHFNKMSYWCRTQILTQEDAKEREKFLMKFIKIMRHLRKLRNFNSYLAILSALDSAPVRRLEWQKQNLEALKEFCHLIDSSSSFRAYRKALAETEPPCIPYLGLILQDLTFINIGNQDALTDGSVNFAKRWQQFNILDSMRRFKTSSYSALKPNPKLVAMLGNFDLYLSEEQLWQISEAIKPRGGRKKPDVS